MKNKIAISRPEIVSLDYIKKHNGSWVANDPDKDDYVHYWVGDFKTGTEVRISSLEILREEIEQLKMENYELENILINKYGEDI